MKLLVLSDSHGNADNLLRAYHAEQPDVILFLGDGAADFAHLQKEAPFCASCSVLGNCDRQEGETERLVSYGGYRFLMTHGHRYNVKFGLMRLFYAAREAMADVVLFGHTHSPYCSQEEGAWMLNPGTCSGVPQTTYGVIEINDGVLQCRIRRLEDGTEVCYDPCH